MEPIDLCLQKQLITTEQHWCGLHLRWLYTLRYGAPSLTTHYIPREEKSGPTEDDPHWRAQREEEYRLAIALLKRGLHYEPVMQLCIYNERPAFLNTALLELAWEQPVLAARLENQRTWLVEGLTLLARHWKRPAKVF
jgi:hypothetical protein